MATEAKTQADGFESKRIGPFALGPLLGRGASASVHRAVCLEQVAELPAGTTVAVKRMGEEFETPAASARALRIVEILATNRHPGIVDYYALLVLDSGGESKQQCLVLEYLKGGTLAERIAQARSGGSLGGGGLPWELVRAVFTSCFAGIRHAIKVKILHRDLKPSNIMVATDDRSAKLIDFELASHIDEAASTGGEIKGTYDYVAPEFHPSFMPFATFSGDEISEAYSLGVCIFEALTGVLPYDAERNATYEEFDKRCMRAEKTPLVFPGKITNVLEGLDQFLKKALASRREKRYQNIEEMEAAFNSIRRRTLSNENEIYEYREYVGRGGFANVYRALRLSDNKSVAIKALRNADYSTLFLKEVRIMKDCTHPNIVRLLDSIQNPSSGQYLIVMEFLDGMPGASLKERITAHPSGMNTREVLQTFVIYARTLHCLHTHYRVIHRDIKPANLYAPEGRPKEAKILDLGVARDLKIAATISKIVPGTLEYMAPELSKGELARGSAQSDIYALALSLFEALTGKPAFPPLPTTPQNATLAAFHERCKKPPPLRFEHPAFQKHPQLRIALERALDPKPERRYGNAENFADALENAGTPVKSSFGRGASNTSSVSGRPVARVDGEKQRVSPLVWFAALLVFGVFFLGLLREIFGSRVNKRWEDLLAENPDSDNAFAVLLDGLAWREQHAWWDKLNVRFSKYDNEQADFAKKCARHVHGILDNEAQKMLPNRQAELEKLAGVDFLGNPRALEVFGEDEFNFLLHRLNNACGRHLIEISNHGQVALSIQVNAHDALHVEPKSEGSLFVDAAPFGREIKVSAAAVGIPISALADIRLVSARAGGDRVDFHSGVFALEFPAVDGSVPGEVQASLKAANGREIKLGLGTRPRVLLVPGNYHLHLAAGESRMDVSVDVPETGLVFQVPPAADKRWKPRAADVLVVATPATPPVPDPFPVPAPPPDPVPLPVPAPTSIKQKEQTARDAIEASFGKYRTGAVLAERLAALKECVLALQSSKDFLPDADAFQARIDAAKTGELESWQKRIRASALADKDDLNIALVEAEIRSQSAADIGLGLESLGAEIKDARSQVHNRQRQEAAVAMRQKQELENETKTTALLKAIDRLDASAGVEARLRAVAEARAFLSAQGLALSPGAGHLATLENASQELAKRIGRELLDYKTPQDRPDHLAQIAEALRKIGRASLGDHLDPLATALEHELSRHFWRFSNRTDQALDVLVDGQSHRVAPGDRFDVQLAAAAGTATVVISAVAKGYEAFDESFTLKRGGCHETEWTHRLPPSKIKVRFPSLGAGDSVSIAGKPVGPNRAEIPLVPGEYPLVWRRPDHLDIDDALVLVIGQESADVAAPAEERWLPSPEFTRLRLAKMAMQTKDYGEALRQLNGKNPVFQVESRTREWNGLSGEMEDAVWWIKDPTDGSSERRFALADPLAKAWREDSVLRNQDKGKGQRMRLDTATNKILDAMTASSEPGSVLSPHELALAAFCEVKSRHKALDVFQGDTTVSNANGLHQISLHASRLALLLQLAERSGAPLREEAKEIIASWSDQEIASQVIPSLNPISARREILVNIMSAMQKYLSGFDNPTKLAKAQVREDVEKMRQNFELLNRSHP